MGQTNWVDIANPKKAVAFLNVVVRVRKEETILSVYPQLEPCRQVKEDSYQENKAERRSRRGKRPNYART